MAGGVVRALVRRGWAGPLLAMGRMTPSHFRIAFLGSALQSGILQSLAREPGTAAELSDRLDLRPEMIAGLRSWLDLGVTLGELRQTKGRYRLKSRLARALVEERNDPVAAMFEELALLDHRLIVETPRRLATGEWFDLADADPTLIARSSRVGEPWIAAGVRSLLSEIGPGPVRLLEIGCGSGAHIRTAAGLNPELTAVGLELQEPAARQARANMQAWGLDDRVRIETGDVRSWPAPGSQPGGFDIVTLHQNIYYFSDEEQQALLSGLGGLLEPGGRLLITTVVRGGGVSAGALDLWGAMTRGAERLPVTDELLAGIRAAGFEQVESRPLGSEGLYRAFVGSWPGGRERSTPQQAAQVS